MLILQDRKKHFLIIKYFFTPRANFFKAGFWIFAIKNLGIDTKIVILMKKFSLGCVPPPLTRKNTFSNKYQQKTLKSFKPFNIPSINSKIDFLFTLSTNERTKKIEIRALSPPFFSSLSLHNEVFVRASHEKIEDLEYTARHTTTYAKISSLFLSRADFS